MKNLYKIRKEKNISQVSLSVQVGVSQETISAYENGKSFPSVDTLLKLCEIFKVSADFLLDKTDIKLTIDEFCEKNISADELELLTYFRKLPHTKKHKALGLLMGMAEE